MKKLFKAVACVAVGCALLSTSAFAALTGSVTANQDGTYGVNVSGVEGESTILVYQSDTELESLPATIDASKIVYINQTTADENNAASYSVNVGARAAAGQKIYFFAGATNNTGAAVLLTNGEQTIPTPTVAATGVTLNQNTLSLTAIGATGTLTATVDPANSTDTVVWSTSDSSVATVANGVVTAVAAGTATITATAGSASAACTVTVSAVNENDYITASDTDKGTIVVDVASVTDSSMGAAVGNRIVSLALNTTVYAEAGNATAGYVVKAVNADGSDIDGAVVYYSAERAKYVALIPVTVSEYKFEVLAEGTANDVIAKYGNINEDSNGLINALDLGPFRQIVKKIQGKVTDSNAKKALIADVTGDGRVNALDLGPFRQAVKKQNPTFAVLNK